MPIVHPALPLKIITCMRLSVDASLSLASVICLGSLRPTL